MSLTFLINIVIRSAGYHFKLSPAWLAQLLERPTINREAVSSILTSSVSGPQWESSSNGRALASHARGNGVDARVFQGAWSHPVFPTHFEQNGVDQVHPLFFSRTVSGGIDPIRFRAVLIQWRF